ncbi:MAG TPA: glycosyl transferase family 1, partial [Cyanothece sp. UBA12306]|nr:glycosyl transferase family 1 [Cyanothece sp. UBA12306]
MKVTFCASDFPNFVGGPAAWLPRLLGDLQDHGIEPQVLFFTSASTPEELEQCRSIQLIKQQKIKHSISNYDQYTDQRVRWVLEQLRKDTPDIFIPNLILSGFYSSYWLKKAKIPTVGIMHSDDPFYHGILDQFVFGLPKYQLSALVCVSRFLEQYVLERGATKSVIRSIPCGVPVPKLTSEFSGQSLKIAYLGRLVEEQKQISQVAKAFCRAVKEVTNTEAIIYGSGSAESSVVKILAEQGQGLPVKLGGSINSDQVQEYLLECHVIVLLSDYEGLPISLMEAMACGVVPVCLRIRSGIPELIEDGVTGLLVDDRGDDFVNAIRRLREEPGLWQRLSRGARAKIEAEYSNKVAVNSWIVLLKELHENSQDHQSIKIPWFLSLDFLWLPQPHPAFPRDPRRPALYNRL